jgi:pimeloyl-ACP methyl ester carboxylesterase
MRPEVLAGEPLRARLAADPAQRFWLLVPAAARARGEQAPLWVSVHGISRNAQAHLRSLAPWAERVGCVLLAPHFSRTRFPDYQRFGRPGRLGAGGRADLMLLHIVAEVQALLGLRQAPIHLMGHSGGAQFVQRFVLAHGERVARYVLSAPGGYAWPDAARRFPFGAAQSRHFGDLRPQLQHLLRVPGLVAVGQADRRRDSSLRQGERIDLEQGRTRLERAQRFVQMLATLAADQGLPAPASLVVLPGSGHAFSEVVAHGGLAGLAVRHLFGAPPPATAVGP